MKSGHRGMWESIKFARFCAVLLFKDTMAGCHWRKWQLSPEQPMPAEKVSYGVSPGLATPVLELVPARQSPQCHWGKCQPPPEKPMAGEKVSEATLETSHGWCRALNGCRHQVTQHPSLLPSPPGRVGATSSDFPFQWATDSRCT